MSQPSPDPSGVRTVLSADDVRRVAAFRPAGLLVHAPSPTVSVLQPLPGIRMTFSKTLESIPFSSPRDTIRMRRM